jgi:hypothetical protein
MFRILQRILPNGKKLQLMLVLTRLGGIFRTVLQFYATHPMSFETYIWVEKFGKITDVQNAKVRLSKRPKLLE